jgi:hypothetical protein
MLFGKPLLAVTISALLGLIFAIFCGSWGSIFGCILILITFKWTHPWMLKALAKVPFGQGIGHPACPKGKCRSGWDFEPVETFEKGLIFRCRCGHLSYYTPPYSYDLENSKKVSAYIYNNVCGWQQIPLNEAPEEIA